jgi:adenine deaminase
VVLSLLVGLLGLGGCGGSSETKAPGTVSGNVVDVLRREIYPATLTLREGRITRITRSRATYDTYLLPGFIDAHVHIESSMLPPSEFARLAVRHGTVATVSDPHEIANVLGIAGVRTMIENGQTVPFKFYFGASPCVPATSFETAGATLGPAEVESLLALDEVKFLSEVMNFPGVLNGDPDLRAKIQAAQRLGKVLDGHAPGLRGEALQQYIDAGISTDHESFEREEGLEKIQRGMKILIREGSAAKNFDTFVDLMGTYPESCMLCSDDKHPNDLVQGHINDLVKRAVQAGLELLDVLQCACVNPVQHYGLEVGLLQEGDPADFIVVDNLEDWTVLRTYINGQLVAKNGRTLLSHRKVETPNRFNASPRSVQDFAVEAKGDQINVIEAIDGQLITKRLVTTPKVVAGQAVSDPDRDLLKIAVVNRYQEAPPALGFIKNFGLREGAIATSVAHDSHNIVAVGVADEPLCAAVNLVLENRGGLAVVSAEAQRVLPLPIAGLMSDADGWAVAERYTELDQLTKELGSTLTSPFMTLSFMALLVIPDLKLSDQGLFDGTKFEMIDLFE